MNEIQKKAFRIALASGEMEGQKATLEDLRICVKVINQKMTIKDMVKAIIQKQETTN